MCNPTTEVSSADAFIILFSLLKDQFLEALHWFAHEADF